MELTDEDLARLAAIQDEHRSAVLARVGSLRAPDEAQRDKQKRAIGAFRKAWHRLDEDVRWSLVCQIVGRVEAEQFDWGASSPDIEPILAGLKADLAGEVPHRAPKVPGFREATMIVWRRFVEARHGVDVPLQNDVPFDREASRAMASVLGPMFNMSDSEAASDARRIVSEEASKARIPGRRWKGGG